MIIDLKDGNFRYWFESDVPLKGGPESYPVEGRYVFENGVLSLPSKFIFQQDWHTFLYKGKPTLWRPAAIEYWQKSKKVDGYGVLFLTDKKPENIWQSKK